MEQDTGNNSFHLDSWSQYLIDEVKTQSEQYETDKRKSNDSATATSAYYGDVEYKNKTNNESYNLEKISLLDKTVWENIPTVISDSIQGIVQEVQGLKSEVSTLQKKLYVKEKKITKMEEERNFYLSEARENFISMENKINTKPSVSFVNACLNTKANKSDVYAMISPPPPIDTEALNERLEKIEKKHEALVQKIAAENKIFCTLEMHQVLEHELHIVRKAVADNTLDDQARYQNCDRRLDKVEKREKKTLDGLTHLSTAMKAINQRMKEKHVDSDDEENAEQILDIKITNIVEKMWNKRQRTRSISIDSHIEKGDNVDEADHEESLYEMVKTRVMSDTKHYVLEQIRKEQKNWESTEGAIETLRKDIKNVQKFSKNAIEQFEELGKEFREEKHIIRKTKASIHKMNEDLKLEIQKIDEKTTSEIHKASKEIHKVNSHTRDLPTQIASLHQLHTSSEQLLTNLNERLDKSTTKFEKTAEQIRRGVYGVTRKMNTAIKKKECIEIIQDILVPKFDFLDKKLTSQKKSLIKYVKKADLKKLNKRVNTTIKESIAEAGYNNIITTASNHNNNSMNVNNNNRLNNDKINNNIQSIEKDVANLEYKLVKHIEFNELDTKVRDEEISKLKNKLEQMNSNTNINSNSSNIQNVYRGNSTNHNNNNRLISSINSRNNNFNIQQQPGYLKDDDFTVESDEEEPMINIDQNQILEKQLKASNLDEPEITESVDNHFHQQETDLILHSLKSQKNILEQRLRELS